MVFAGGVIGQVGGTSGDEAEDPEENRWGKVNEEDQSAWVADTSHHPTAHDAAMQMMLQTSTCVQAAHVDRHCYSQEQAGLFTHLYDHRARR